MSDIDSLASPEIQTKEDELSGEFCECGHLLNEHFNGEFSRTSKCFALIFNGTVWSSCRCNRSLPKIFEIRVEIYAENLQTRA